MRRKDHPRAFPPALIAIASLATAAACGSAPSKPAQAHSPAATKQTTQAVTTTPQSFMSQRYSIRVVLTKY